MPNNYNPDDGSERRPLKTTKLNAIPAHTQEPVDVSRQDQLNDQKNFSSRDIGGALKKARAKSERTRKREPETRPRGQKPMTESRIRNISEYYVSQREASSGMLRDMLHRRAYAWLQTLDDGEIAEKQSEFSDRVEAQIAKLIESGLIDDKRYAELKARSARSSGKGSRRIAIDLAKKGISPDLIADAIAAADAEIIDTEDPDIIAEESERASAEKLAQKKRLGPFRQKPLPSDPLERAKIWKREAGVLARAGYGMDIIRHILDREPDIED